MDALRRHADAVRAEGPLGDAEMLRKFEAGERVAARLELSAGGWLRSREAGLDVMGDGALVPYAGAIRKRRLASGTDQDAFDAIRETLAG